MKQIVKLAAAAAAGAVASGTIVYAQAKPADPQAIVSLYRAAPGQQEALLRWLAQQDRVARAVGQAPMQLYVHTSGDSWDYMGINPVTTQAQDDAFDAEARKMGVTAGPKAGVELRKYLAVHTDTTTIGPISADQALARIAQ